VANTHTVCLSFHDCGSPRI
jgi:hypothetical protein